MSDTDRPSRWTATTVLAVFVSFVPLVLSPAQLPAGEAGSGALIEKVMEETNIDRGLCSILGFDTEAALQLVRSGDFLIHVRHPDAATVQTLRETAGKAGFGIDRVVVEQGSLDKLPYANNIVDLLLATQVTLDDLDTLKVDEILRVLRPEGVAVIGNIEQRDASNAYATRLKEWSAIEGAETLAAPRPGFVVLRKRPLEGTDEWPHWEKSPDNNPVSTDQNIKAPYMTQFLAEPYYICMPAITTAAGGRTFLATGHIAHHRREWEMVNQLIARNGYNGTILWQRKLPEGFLSHRSAFVATKETFYLLDGNGCLLLDAATGKEQGRISIPGVEGDWKWMALKDGVLYVMAGPEGGDSKVILGDRTFGGWSWADLSEGYYGQPHVPWGFGNIVAAYDIADERLAWKHEEKDLIDSRAMAMRDDKIFLYCPERHFRCLTIDTGEILWSNEDSEVRDLIEQPGRGLVSTPGFRSSCIAVASEDALIIQGQTRMNVVALSTVSGSLLWTKKKFTNNPNAIFVDGNAVLGVGDRGSHVVLNPVTGEVLEDLHFRKVSCTRLTASTDSFFVRGEGTLRFDRESKKVLIDGGIRPACNDGVIPAHGLLYVGPWACDCNLTLIGAMAKCSAGDFRFDYVATEEDRLQRGDGDIETVAPFVMDDNDWPTYRADNQRTASSGRRLATPNPQGQPATVPRWAYAPQLECVPTPPVTAGGRVFVAGDDGIVRAIDAKNGQLAWQYATTGPIKASPTIWEGRVYVGSGDGYAYALEAATGRLLWRFRAAPVERYIMVYGNLCSTWPVNSGVLVEDGIAYFAAGIIDHDGTYVFAVDAKSGKIQWQNNTCGHLNKELRKGVSVQGNLAIHGDKLLMAGGNQTSPAMFDLATGECLNPTFQQGQPKANHGRFVGVIQGEHPVAGGRVLYASPRNVANKDSFVVLRAGRPLPLSYGGIPPAWNEEALTMVNFRNGKLSCYEMGKTGERLQQGFPRAEASDRPARRWHSLADALDADGASRWKSDLNSSNKFEVLALAATPGRIAAIVQVQVRHRAHPQFQVQALSLDDGTPAWFWQHDLPSEPLPEGLAVGSEGQLIVATLQGQILSIGPKQPR
ncbi:MAG: PQQ-binding-like beta-propeller repeat protein, partial [Pirellulaceae bacterium]